MVEGWDPAVQCNPRCTYDADGGYAWGVWEIWNAVANLDADPLTGHSEWVIDWNALRFVTPSEIQGDDDERLELVASLRSIQALLANPASILDDDEGAGDD